MENDEQDDSEENMENYDDPEETMDNEINLSKAIKMFQKAELAIFIIGCGILLFNLLT